MLKMCQIPHPSMSPPPRPLIGLATLTNEQKETVPAYRVVSGVFNKSRDQHSMDIKESLNCNKIGWICRARFSCLPNSS